MTMTNPEQVSLLVDGELDARELPQVVAALKSDPELKSCWARYHLIGDAVRKNLPGVSHRGFAERVTHAIQNEPAYLCPQIPARPPRKSVAPPIRHAAGFALAASITALTVVGLMQFEQPARPALEIAAVQPQQLAAAVEQPFGRASHTLGRDTDGSPAGAFRIQNAAFVEADQPSQQYRAEADDLYDYLVNYHRYAMAADQGEILSYIRYAGHTSY